MKYHVYILYSPSSGKYYVGQSGDLSGRLVVHNSDRSDGYTRLYKPWELFWSMAFDNRSKAIRVETYLKKKPRAFIRRLAEDTDLIEYINLKYS